MKEQKTPIVGCEEACTALKAGQLIVFSTETYYALGCDPFNEEAIQSVFLAKTREKKLALPVVIGQFEQLAELALVTCEVEELLMHAFWPAPLTILLQAHSRVPSILTAHTGRIAVRYSPHQGVQQLCLNFGGALVASSANISGHKPVATVGQLQQEILHRIAGIFDSAPTPLGNGPSTIITVVKERNKEKVRIIRLGAVAEIDFLQAGFLLAKA